MDANATALVEEGLLDVRAACDFLKCSRSFLYVAMDAGQIPFCRVGRLRRVPKRGLIMFAVARLNGCVGPTETKGAG